MYMFYIVDTCRFSLCLKLLITERFLYASLDFFRRGPRKGSKFCKGDFKANKYQMEEQDGIVGRYVISIY
jgi:hypothetical protein